MKILFVSGELAGGAPRSTIELARRLSERGHQVDVVLGERPAIASLYQRAVNLYIKTCSLPVVGTGLKSVLRVTGQRTEMHVDSKSKVRIFHAKLPENGYRALHRENRYDIVVANSLPRVAMAWMATDLQSSGTPFIVYLRESHAVTHFTVTGLRPAGAVANSRELQLAVLAEGVPCEFVPSIVDLSAVEVDSIRETVVLVNPIEENRPDLMASMAAERPDIPFVLQESWPLDDITLTRLGALTTANPNLSLRRRVASPRDVYRDARVLIAPYPLGRPRVVLEAQHNGVPVIGLNQPALAEAVGEAGVLVGADADDETWLRELARLWDDGDHYRELSVASREWARRDEVQPEHVVARFEQFIESVVEAASA